MKEIYNQILSQLVGIWRRRWWAAMVTWIVCVGGWGFVANMPDTYQSSARVYIDAQSMLEPLMRGLAVENNIFSQIEYMKRTLLSRPNLEKVTRMTDLDLSVKDSVEMDELITRLEDNITISSQGPNLFRISFENNNPEMAKKVVQSLLTIFVESNLGASRKDLTTATRFIDEQIRFYERQLEQAENRLADFKRRNMGFLPGEGSYYNRLQEAQADLAVKRSNLAEAVSRRDKLAEQLKEVPQFLEYEVEKDSLENGSGPGPQSGLEVKILDLEYKIDQMLQHYTEKHPDVIAARRLLASLKEKLKEEQAGPVGGSGDGEAAVPKAPQKVKKTIPNPVYEQVKVQLVQAETQLATLRLKVNEAEGQVAKWQSLAETVPQVEAELKRLNRDYGQFKKNHDQLLARRESARLAQDLETKADSVEFRVVDPPQVPLTPSGPNRLLFLSVVLVGGVGAGISLAFALSQIDDSISNVLRLRESFALPVLGGVSAIVSRTRKRRHLMEVSGFAMVTTGLFTAYGGLVALEFFNVLRGL